MGRDNPGMGVKQQVGLHKNTGDRGEIMKNKSNLIKYGFLSLIYDRFFTFVFSSGRKKSFSMIKIRKDDKVLLVGVGTGLDLPLLPAGARVTGVDISPVMLLKAEKRKTSGTRLMVMNAEKLKFKSGSFDIVILNFILTVVENPPSAMREALRVLKKGGRILVWDKFSRDKKPGFVRRMFNVVTSFMGTDITRNFEEISRGMKFSVLRDEPGMFGGNFRTILIKK